MLINRDRNLQIENLCFTTGTTKGCVDFKKEYSDALVAKDVLTGDYLNVFLENALAVIAGWC